MIIVEDILGNLKRDARWQACISHITPDVVELSQWEAQKSRCRKTTRNGTEIGISLPRDKMLSDGDILIWDEANNYAVIVHIQLRDVMVIHLRGLLAHDVNTVLKISFELGHALGNQHWKAVIKADRIFIPLTVGTHVMDSVMKTHGFHSLPYAFVRGETVLPELTQPEARLLFGGAEDAATHVHVNNAVTGPHVIKLK